MRRATPVLALVLLAGCLGVAPPPGDGAPGPAAPPEPLAEAWLQQSLPPAPVPFDGLLAAGKALAASPRVTLVEEGRSVEGRPLLGVLLRGDGAGPKPLAFLTGSQHGNEPSGSDAALLLATYYAWGGAEARQVLAALDVYVLLCANPDGRVLDRRGNADGVDLNRDHMNLLTPEARALHAAFLRLGPAVVLDLHQFGGGGDLPVGQADVFEVGVPQDPFAHPGTVAASAELAAAVRDAVDAAYGPGATLVYGPTDASQGGSIHRNHYALHHGASLLFEADRTLPAYQDQVALQVIASQAVLKAAAREPARYAQARADAEAEPPPAALQGWLAAPHARLPELWGLAQGHGLPAGLAEEAFTTLAVAEDGGLGAVRTGFPAGTMVLPAGAPGWRVALELMESTPANDPHYTAGPRSLGIPVYVEPAAAPRLP